jgi:hypothetical protein
MALAARRTGIIFTCDRGNHEPDPNKLCDFHLSAYVG